MLEYLINILGWLTFIILVILFLTYIIEVRCSKGTYLFTLFRFGVLLIDGYKEPDLAETLRRAGYNPIWDLGRFDFGIATPRWVYNLINRNKA